MNDGFIALPPHGSIARGLELEYQWVGPPAPAPGAPTMVFLHEGLGCIELWRSFPADLCARLQWRGLVYSRFAYGASTPRPHAEPFPSDYLERETLDVLPRVLRALGIERPWLLGHSDGGSMALLAAANDPGSEHYAGIIAIAPHYCVEEVCIAGIERARATYEQGGLRRKLAKYHRDVDSAFYGWCDAWLNPRRRGWSIAGQLQNITCPVLAIQGVQDEYATLEQIEAIQRHAPHSELLAIDGSGHLPFLAFEERVIEAIARFCQQT
ncbi:MAG: alpha/beta hydrolase [Azoarcus sp.]|jgi:pimeloyl-ACP methyl ester carboxylesterase|nr:alpha/beta hydrolase [Azoarcus sp.]